MLHKTRNNTTDTFVIQQGANKLRSILQFSPIAALKKSITGKEAPRDAKTTKFRATFTEALPQIFSEARMV